MNDSAILAFIGIFLGICFAADAWANVKVIRLLEKSEAEETTGERKWHL